MRSVSPSITFEFFICANFDLFFVVLFVIGDDVQGVFCECQEDS